MAVGKVPIADSHDFEDRSLVVVVRNARAVTQITVSFSLTWPALEQRELMTRRAASWKSKSKTLETGQIPLLNYRNVLKAAR